MQELILLLCIGVGLSIDAFSVSTCMGMINLPIRKIINISLTVGIFHFVMPILGLIASNLLSKIVYVNTDLILGIVLILISLQMFIEYIRPSDKTITLNKFGILLFSFGVSLDSFSIGLGLSAITTNFLMASTVFSLCSFSFTFLGLSIGKYLNTLLKKYSYLLGTLFLFFIGLLFLCKNL